MSASKALRLVTVGTAIAAASTFGNAQPIAIAPAGPAAQIKKWDPTVPVRIEDVSKLQAEKMHEDTLKRFGMTSGPATAPSNPPPVSVTPTTKPKIPTHTVQVLAVYGTGEHLKAEMLVDGTFRMVKAGEVLWPGMQITQINQRITLARALGKQKVQQLHLAAGEVWEGR